MISDKILFIDTETGGIDPTINSLLSIGFVLWQNFKIIASKEIHINDGFMNVTKNALEVNKINLLDHTKKAISPREAIKEIDSFLALNFEPTERITLGGHNINFDLNFLKIFYSASNYNYNKRYSHRSVDTATILYYLYLSGIIKTKAISSDEAFKMFNINIPNRHSAISDAIATAELFSKLLKLLNDYIKVNPNT